MRHFSLIAAVLIVGPVVSAAAAASTVVVPPGQPVQLAVALDRSTDVGEPLGDGGGERRADDEATLPALAHRAFAGDLAEQGGENGSVRPATRLLKRLGADTYAEALALHRWLLREAF